MSGDVRLQVSHVVTDNGVVDDAYVLVRDGRVAGIAALAEAAKGDGLPGDPSRQAMERQDDRHGLGHDPAHVDAERGLTERLDGWLVPGFVDTHCHGGGGADFGSADRAEILRAIGFHRAHGTTTTFASLVSADPDTLVAQIAALVPLVEEGELAGIHLEGPYLSPLHRGAHSPQTLTEPSRESVARLLAAGRGHIRMVTLAPELNAGLTTIRQLADAGVVAAFGHSDADELMLAEALDAGARVATHLFNAMRPIHHRDPGPIPRLLTDDRATVELICDGFHLHPDVIALAVQTAGADRVALVTDAMLAAGVEDGDFHLGSLAVTVTDGQARLVEPDGSLGSIAGSTLTMAQAFERLVGSGISVVDAAAMAATTPARCHGLDRIGVITVGSWADFCLVDDRGRLQRVMRGGGWVGDAAAHEPSTT